MSAIARAAVTEFGKSSRLGQFVGDERRLSNQTKARIDREVERLVATAYGDALALLEEHRRKLDLLAERLLEARELERVDIVSAIVVSAQLSKGSGKSPLAPGTGGLTIQIRQSCAR